MRVRDIMGSNVITLREGDGVALAMQIMLWSGLRHLPVLRGDLVVGVVSERDLLPHKSETGGAFRTDRRVEEVMTKPAVVIDPDASVEDAADRMAPRRIGCLPVIDHDRLVGIVTITDLAAVIARHGVTQRISLSHHVSGLMTANPATAAPDDPLVDAAARMLEHHTHHLAVVDTQGRVIGILSDRDVRTVIGDPLAAFEKQGEGPLEHRVAELRVRDAMTPDPRSVRATAELADAVQHLLDGRVGALPVIDEHDHLVGIVSYLDILRHMSELT